MALKFEALLILLVAFGFIDALNDYTYIKSTKHLYKLHKNRVTWSDAASRCKDEGAQLFIPENESEVKEVLSAVDVVQGNWVWIGIADLGKKRVYQAVDGRPVNEVYNNWWSGQPGDASNKEFCVTLVVDTRKLRVYTCDARQYYICKKVLWSADLMDEAKNIVATAGDKVAARLEGQMANQTAALGRLAELMQRQVADQAAAWALLTQAVANQTAILERQALMIEKIASNEDDSQLDVRAQQ